MRAGSSCAQHYNRSFSKFQDIEVVAFCGDHESLLAAIKPERPDAVVTDVRLPPTGTDEGIQVARELRMTHPNVAVVVLCRVAEPSHVLGLFEAGPAGRAYLLAERLTGPQQLASAIESVTEGGSAIDPRVVEVLVRARFAEGTSWLSS